MAIDQELLALLVCPKTKEPLIYDQENQRLVSEGAGVAYPIRDGIPVLIEQEAIALK
jgi:uncharacterized protein YbaR (Trm112 family)